jgi:hypothetical protein
MKVHDNSGFRGVGVVSASAANFFESKRLVECSGWRIGLSHLQKDHPFVGCEQRQEESLRHTRPTTPRRDGEVQDLPFIGRRASGDKKPDDLSSKFCNRNVIPDGVPTGGLGTGGLDGSDRGAVILASGSDDHYFFGA